jgi:hypothetical protein
MAVAFGVAKEKRVAALACLSSPAAAGVQFTAPRGLCRDTSHRETIAEALAAARLGSVALVCCRGAAASATIGRGGESIDSPTSRGNFSHRRPQNAPSASDFCVRCRLRRQRTQKSEREKWLRSPFRSSRQSSLDGGKP